MGDIRGDKSDDIAQFEPYLQTCLCARGQHVGRVRQPVEATPEGTWGVADGSFGRSQPSAMPLADYIAEVMQVLDESDLCDGDILVERVKTLRQAEENHDYKQKFMALNEH